MKIETLPGSETCSAVDESVLDLLMDLREADGSAQLLPELIRLFERQTPELLEDLRSSTCRLELKRVADIAHKLKGSCANLGAWSMMNMCEKIEMCGRSKDGNQEVLPLEFVDRLHKEFVKVKSALKKYEVSHLS